jgi:hypothetical protein
MSGQRRLGADREHQGQRRSRRVNLRLDEDEHAAIAAAALRTGLTPAGYAAEVALANALDRRPPEEDDLRPALLELMQARTQVRRYAVNVNQAVRELNATGSPPAWLVRAVAVASQAVARLDAAAVALTSARRSRGARTTGVGTGVGG